MQESTTALMPYRAESFLSDDNLGLADAAVTEIFNMMFGFDTKAIVVAETGVPPLALNERTAIVGFSGAMRGSCQIQMSSDAACAIASAMLGGATIDEEDDSINDALGELCNMLAGGWKNSIPELSSECALSPPTVISGRDYKVHVRKPSVSLSRAYEFDVHTFHLTLRCEEIGPAHE
jgi:chemotaxis protein CheX